MVLCFGEILMRIAPDAEGNWLQNNEVQIYPGGSELNVAVALAKWKVPVSYCTAVPDNFLSAQFRENIKSRDIDISTILSCGEKIGIYYLLQGKEIQHSEIIYDRKCSAFYELKPGMINWDHVLQGIRWFHFSAISPALNENVAAVCKEALQACSKKNITVSIDLNYRSKLWQEGRQPNKIIQELVQYCDIVMGNLWSMEKFLELPVQKDIHTINTKENYTQQAKKTSANIINQFPKCKLVACTFRFDKQEIEYFATIFSNKNLYISGSYHSKEISDKVGSGDCFMAGLIYGMYNHLPFQQMVNFAAAAAFQKLFIKGDQTHQTVEEIKTFILNQV